jgi:hypothetical protein
MGCSCCGGKKKPVLTDEEKTKRLKVYLASLQRLRCECGGIMKRYPEGVFICTVCRKKRV